MALSFSIAGPEDAPELLALENAAAANLASLHGRPASATSERAFLFQMSYARVIAARADGRIVGKLFLQTRKPWAIDITYFTPVKKAIYLTGMAVIPFAQRQGVGRAMLEEAERQVREWPAEAIRLDAFDAPHGAGGFYAKCGFRECGRRVYRDSPLIYFERILV